MPKGSHAAGPRGRLSRSPAERERNAVYLRLGCGSIQQGSWSPAIATILAFVLMSAAGLAVDPPKQVEPPAREPAQRLILPAAPLRPAIQVPAIAPRGLAPADAAEGRFTPLPAPVLLQGQIGLRQNVVV